MGDYFKSPQINKIKSRVLTKTRLTSKYTGFTLIIKDYDVTIYPNRICKLIYDVNGDLYDIKLYKYNAKTNKKMIIPIDHYYYLDEKLYYVIYNMLGGNIESYYNSSIKIKLIKSKSIECN